MSEFLSSEDLSSLLLSNSKFVLFPIRANSSSNLIDITRKNNALKKTNNNVSPKKKFHSMDDIFDASVRTVIPVFGIMSDCVPSPESDSSYASSSESEGTSNSSSPRTCEISLLERLIRTHPVWFLPSLQRSEALHLLQGREVSSGQFIVRSSTHPKTMAVSVKLPGNHVEHYLLKSNGNAKISLENSSRSFDTVHQLIAHYCETADEIPVCLRMPGIIADATSPQQLASLALLGQEFWSLPGGSNNPPTPTPTTDTDVSRNFTLLGSQSSSSHSLSDLSKKPSRPTTLELGGKCASGVTPTPPPVPLRWSRSALLSPVSQPSSIQSTPSEVQSTFSEKSGRPGKKKKRNSGSNHKPESIHYKDTEILALDIFKGTKTVYDDKASDYEDLEIWNAPKLSTFKKPTSLTPPDSNNFNNPLLRNSNKSNFNQNKSTPSPENKGAEELLAIQNMNIHNHRLSLNGQNLMSYYPRANNRDENISKSQCNVNTAVSQNDVNRKSNGGVYSEPVDSIVSLRKLNNNNGNRNTTTDQPNIRWSQPTLSLLKLDFSSNNSNVVEDDNNTSMTGNVQGKPNIIMKPSNSLKMNPDVAAKYYSAESKNLNIGQQAISINTQSTDVSLANKSLNHQVCAISNNSKSSSTHKSNSSQVKNQQVTCARLQMINREEEGENENVEKSTNVTERKDGSSTSSIKKKLCNTTSSEAPEMTEIPNKAWCLDNSWELVMWQKEEERRLKGNVAKFPIVPSPPNTPHLRSKATPPSESSQTENSSSTNNNSTNNETYNSLQRRFSCYDNLEKSKAEINDDNNEESNEDDDEEEKISPPWNSSKWEHLMRIISESTQQLDLLSSVGNNNTVHSDSNNASLHGSEISRPSYVSDPVVFPITRMLEVGGNVDKAGKSVAAVVRNLATKEDGVFGPTLKSFISCTIAARIQDPYKVMRNVRQFISGMKNYLVGANSESEELRKEIKKQTETLNQNEYLNIDKILEENVLVDLVISPLHLHLMSLIQNYHTKNGDPLYLPSTPDITKFEREHQNSHAKLKTIYLEFEDLISPMKKLDKWNEFVCQVQELDNYSSDSFLPLLSETLGIVIKCHSNQDSVFSSHVDYMVGLLPTALAERNNYSLLMLQSAVSSLKVKGDARKASASLTSVRVLIPNESNGTLIRKMVPIRNSTTNKDVAKILASKLSITNPTDYVLVTIKNGEEIVCPETELVANCIDATGTTALAYKREDAKIGWPKSL